MKPPADRPFTLTRIVALTVIGLIVSGLAYAHFGRGSSTVSVPSGAKAGQLTLAPCHYTTEKGSYAADCGTLVVPENRHSADSRLIALPVTRIRAQTPHPGAPVFRLQGGPGITNMDFPAASRFAAGRDVVLVGYRGVDGSVRLDCPEVDSAMKRAADLADSKAIDAYAGAYRSCSSRLQTEGVDLAGYSLPERVDDLEAARRALGYRKVDLVSESAGTRTAMIYAWRYPKSVERSVMIGANPPGNFIWYPSITDEQVGKYAKLCAQEGSCSNRTGDLAVTLRSTQIPHRWWFLPIKKGNVRIATFFGLMNATPAGAGPISAPRTIDSWFEAADGDPSGLWLQSVMAQLVFPSAQVHGELAAVGRMDAAAVKRYFAGPHGRGSILGDTASSFLFADGRIVSSWPAGPDDNAYSHVRTSRVPTLLVSGDLDFATPPQTAARELLPHLPNGHQVVLKDLGHADDFWAYEPAAGSHLVNAFLANGKVDPSRFTTTRIDFTPHMPQTSLAKIVLLVMLVLAGLAVLSMLVLPLRVHRRGRIGRKSAVAIRSLGLLVIGLGGWLGGILVALATMPTVPLDSDLLAGLSVGVPVGLAVYWAWVDRDWTAATKTTGLVAALAGALAGGWLGCHAASAPFAVVTTILGAAAGGNLLVVVLDMLRRPVAAAAGGPAMRPQES